jgi:RNA polymerase sigma-70 factor (ECF subfamily)
MHDARDEMDEFEAQRPLLFGIAYRMLGSVSDAEDILQDAYLRYAAVPRDSIQAPRAFLATIVTRLCLNALQSARARREAYVGPWLPEPLLTDDHTADGLVEDAESISMALLVLLETLTPIARAVFLLREVFDYDYREIGAIVDHDEAACRQIFSRARRELAAQRRRFRPSEEAHRRMLDTFLGAVSRGDMAGLTALLSDDVVLWTDGGGKAAGAATRPVRGRGAVATFVMATAAKRFAAAPPLGIDVASINGEPGFILREGDRPFGVLTMDLADDQIHTLRVFANPDKLRHVARKYARQ